MQDHQKMSQQEQGEGEKENTSEISRLFASVLTKTTKDMDEEQAAAYLAEILDGGVEADHLFERLITDTNDQPFLVTSSHHPDKAVREASLAPRDQWQENQNGELAFQASNALQVYLGESGQPLKIGEALDKLRLLSDSAVLTARIVLGLWNSRRTDPDLNIDGSVPVLLDELLVWQGYEKNKRFAHPGNTTKRYTDGYRTTQKQRVIKDMTALAACHVRGVAQMNVGGQHTQIEIDGPYLRYDLVSRRTRSDERILIGFLVAPGGWIRTYERGQNELFAQIDRQIFRLNPQNDRYALRIALYLTERWREQAKSSTFSTPISMNNLLAASMIEVDKNRLTSELAPKIEMALERLEAMHVVGKQMCLNPVDKQQARWGKGWLTARWEILPPIELIRAYQPKLNRKKRLAKGES